jgi:hypothetical protein
MKKNYIILALALTATLSSCDKQTDNFVPNSNEATANEMVMTATRTNETETRTSIDGLKFSWEATDKLGIYLSKRGRKTTFTHLSGAGTSNASFTGTLAPENEYIYATYPETPTFNTSNSTVTATFTLPTDQIQEYKIDKSIDPTSAGDYAYMYGRTKQRIDATDDFAVEMSHLMTIFDFNLKDIPDYATIQSLRVTAKSGIPGSQTVNLDHNTVTNGAWHTGAVSVRALRMMHGTAGKLTFRLLMFPTSVTPSTVWDVRLTTSHGEYFLEKKFTKNKTYEAGKRYNVSLDCSAIGRRDIYIPDVNFKKFLVENFDTNKDGEISKEEALKVTRIWCTSKGIKSLEGIASFKNLTVLNCSFNQLTSLDVSNNTALTYLDCSNNQLTLLDVSNNTALTDLDCSSNQLTSLNLSNNTALTDLDCYYNQLTSLNFSNNTALTDLFCFSNAITSLDIRPIKTLERFYCDPMKGNGTTNLLQTLTHRAGQFLSNFIIPAETRRIVGK